MASSSPSPEDLAWIAAQRAAMRENLRARMERCGYGREVVQHVMDMLESPSGDDTLLRPIRDTEDRSRRTGEAPGDHVRVTIEGRITGLRLGILRTIELMDAGGIHPTLIKSELRKALVSDSDALEKQRRQAMCARCGGQYGAGGHGPGFCIDRRPHQGFTGTMEDQRSERLDRREGMPEHIRRRYVDAADVVHQAARDAGIEIPTGHGQARTPQGVPVTVRGLDGREVKATMRIYDDPWEALRTFIESEGPACPNPDCEHEHCAGVRELRRHAEQHAPGREFLQVPPIRKLTPAERAAMFDPVENAKAAARVFRASQLEENPWITGLRWDSGGLQWRRLQYDRAWPGYDCEGMGV